MTKVAESSGVRQELGALVKRMDEMNAEVQSIGRAVKGDPSLGQLGIIPRLEGLEKRLNEVDARRADLEKRESYQMGRHAVMAAGISVIISGLIAFGAAFITAKLQPEPAYYVVNTGQGPADGQIVLTPSRNGPPVTISKQPPH